MAPSTCDRSSFPVKGPRFFKIIHSPISQNQKLRIPRDFIKRYGKNLSSPVLLKVPGGNVWPVELINADGNFWLQNGWQEFTEFYSLGYGHFMVFRYDENCHFHVLIFDKSASEIEYPFSTTGSGQSNRRTQCKVRKRQYIEIDASVEILDDFPAREKTPVRKQIKKNVPIEICDDFPSRRTRSKTMASHEMMRPNLTCKTENTTDSEAFFPTFRSRETPTNSVKPAKLDAHGYPRCSTKEIKKECNDDMVTTPRRLQSMVPQGTRSHVPRSFVRKYLRKQSTIMLRAEGGTWYAKCRLNTNNAKLYAGWNSFARDNNLEVGDVCVFELIRDIELSLRVTIFPAMEDAKCIDRGRPV